MYFSKTVYLIFTILTVRILLSNGHNMQCKPSHSSAKYHEYVEGLLKLKGRMLSHAMKMLLQQEDNEERRDHGKGGEATDEHFIDLGSHPIATPRTLHAEDFTMPPHETTTCTTTEDVPETKPTTKRTPFNNLKYGSNCIDRAEEATTRRHHTDMEETATQRTNKMKGAHGEHTEENREEEVATRKHGLDSDEAITHRHHHKNKQDEENREDEQYTTCIPNLENEETNTVRHKAKNHHKDEDHGEATTTRGNELESEDADKSQNRTKVLHKSKDGEEETSTKKSQTEKEEESIHGSRNKTIENNDEEVVTRKEGTSHKVISCNCNHGSKTSTGGHEDKDSDNDGRKHGEHETNIEKPHAKSNETTTSRKGGDELVRNIALSLLKSHILHKNETTTENAQENQTGDETTDGEETAEECSEEEESANEEDGEENETCEPEDEEVESTTAASRKNQIESKAELEEEGQTERTSAHEPSDEENLELLIFEPLNNGAWKQVRVEGHTTSGPDKEVTNSAESHTTSGPDKKVSNSDESHTTCGPDEEEIPDQAEESAANETQRTSAHGPPVETDNNKQHYKLLILKPIKNAEWIQGGAEGHTTCGPDEVEIPNPLEPHTTCGPDEIEIPNPAEAHELTNSGEPGHTTCGPDEEEISNPAEKSTDLEIHTAKPPNPTQTSGPLEILSLIVTTPIPGVPNERPTDITPTNGTTLATPTSMEAYPTMCFPVTEPPAVNATPETTTQVSNQNVSITPSNDTQTTTTPASQNTSSEVTQPPLNVSMENTTQSPQPTPAPVTQEATTQSQPTVNSPESTTITKPPNNTEEVTTQSLSGYATMCYPVTEAATPSATTTKPPPQTHTQKRRRQLKKRWKAQQEFHAPSMRAKLRRVVRELRNREHRAVDKSKMLTLVHYAGQPHYQRYYLRGLKDSGSSDARYKKRENYYYPDEQEDPKVESRGNNLQIFDYDEVKDEDQSGIFEDAMRVKLPFCPTKSPPPQPMAQKCAGKNHNIQHFRQQTTKTPLSFMPLEQCTKKCETEMSTPPYIIPFPKMDTEPNNVCKSPNGADFYSLDNNFGDKDKSDTAKGCNDFDIEQFTKKSPAQISLENFRKQEQADPIQQKLSFMGRLLGRSQNCGNTKSATNAPKALPIALPTTLPIEQTTTSKAKSFFPLQKLFNKWFKPQPNCDKCHQKVKLKDLLHHRDSIKRLNSGTTKTKRQKSAQLRNIRQRKSESGNHRRHRSNFGSALHSKPENKRSRHTRYSKAKKAAEDRFTEHRKRRRHALRRRPRRTNIYEESNSHLNWRSDGVPDLPQSWNGNFESDIYNIL